MAMAVVQNSAILRPAHVSESLTYDFDVRHDHKLVTDPHKRIWNLLVQHARPVFRTPRHGGHWIFLRHAANFNATRNAESFSSSFLSVDQIKALTSQAGAGANHIPIAAPIRLDLPQDTK